MSIVKKLKEHFDKTTRTHKKKIKNHTLPFGLVPRYYTIEFDNFGMNLPAKDTETIIRFKTTDD